MYTKHTSLRVIILVACFGFEGWIWVLIASVPDLSILVTYIKISSTRLLANMPEFFFCYLQTSVTSKFTENLLVTDICQLQIHRFFASDNRLSVANLPHFCY